MNIFKRATNIGENLYTYISGNKIYENSTQQYHRFHTKKPDIKLLHKKARKVFEIPYIPKAIQNKILEQFRYE